MAIVKNAGTKSLTLSTLTSLTPFSIKQPTQTKAEDAAAPGIEANNGNKKIERPNKIAVVNAVNPVLPPAEIPAPDSTKVVTVEVPNNAPLQRLPEHY